MDGNGIDSTAAHNDSNSLHALGYVDSAQAGAPLVIVGGTITVKYTLYGDNNVDGSVTTADFQDFIDGFTHGGSTWFQGDYTYDGAVDLGNDFNLFLRAYLSQGGSMAGLVDVIEGSSLSGSQKASLLAAVPEPASGLLLLGAGTVAIRRRRK